ncbi:MAG: hypothetical protein U0T69_11200 [Chitinophagales bacterium]
MHADIQGALNQINRSWRAFEHRGQKLTKQQVKDVLTYGLKMGYQTTKELDDYVVDKIINKQPLLTSDKKLNQLEIF